MRFKCLPGQHRFQKTVFPSVVSYQQKERRHNHILKIFAKQPISLKILIDSTAYLLRTLLGPKFDLRILGFARSTTTEI